MIKMESYAVARLPDELKTQALERSWSVIKLIGKVKLRAHALAEGFTECDTRSLEHFSCYGYVRNKPSVPSAAYIGSAVAGNGRVVSCRDEARQPTGE